MWNQIFLVDIKSGSLLIYILLIYHRKHFDPSMNKSNYSFSHWFLTISFWWKFICQVWQFWREKKSPVVYRLSGILVSYMWQKILSLKCFLCVSSSIVLWVKTRHSWTNSAWNLRISLFTLCAKRCLFVCVNIHNIYEQIMKPVNIMLSIVRHHQ